MRNLGSSARRLYTAGLMDGSTCLPLMGGRRVDRPMITSSGGGSILPGPTFGIDHAQDQQASGWPGTGDSAGRRALVASPAGTREGVSLGNHAGHGAGGTGHGAEAGCRGPTRA